MLQVKNWSRFQHYRDRCPPWIKLATTTFQDLEFSRMQPASKLLAICIWTLASRSRDGTVPDDLPYIAQWGFLTGQVSNKNLEELVNNGFIIRASNSLAECSQNATFLLERGEERRDRGEAEERQRRRASNSLAECSKEGEKEKTVAALPEWLPLESWNAFTEMRSKIKKPMTDKAKAMMIRKLETMGGDASEILDQSTMNCWQGIFPIAERGNGSDRKQGNFERGMKMAEKAIEEMK